MPGLPELLVILVIVLIVFGANKLPGIGDALGRTIKNFKKASNVDDADVDTTSATVTRKAVGGAKNQAALEGVNAVDDEDDDEEWEEVVVRRKKKSVS